MPTGTSNLSDYEFLESPEPGVFDFVSRKSPPLRIRIERPGCATLHIPKLVYSKPGLSFDSKAEFRTDWQRMSEFAFGPGDESKPESLLAGLARKIDQDDIKMERGTLQGMAQAVKALAVLMRSTIHVTAKHGALPAESMFYNGEEKDAKAILDDVVEWHSPEGTSVIGGGIEARRRSIHIEPAPNAGATTHESLEAMAAIAAFYEEAAADLGLDADAVEARIAILADIVEKSKRR